MKAKITIKGRREPLYLNGKERINKLRDRRFGLNGVKKADPNDSVEIDGWVGDYSRISDIEIISETKQAARHEKVSEEEKKELLRFRNMSPEQKAQNLGVFCMAYAMVVGDYGAEPPQELKEKAIAIQVEYYKKHTDATLVPKEVFAEILPPISERSMPGISSVLRQAIKIKHEM